MNVEDIVYIGAFLNAGEKGLILKDCVPPPGGTLHCDHVTLGYGVNARVPELINMIGKEVMIKIITCYYDTKAMCCSVELPSGVLCFNKTPHITLWCNDWVRPNYSNELLQDPNRERYEIPYFSDNGVESSLCGKEFVCTIGAFCTDGVIRFSMSD